MTQNQSYSPQLNTAINTARVGDYIIGWFGRATKTGGINVTEKKHTLSIVASSQAALVSFPAHVAWE